MELEICWLKEKLVNQEFIKTETIPGEKKKKKLLGVFEAWLNIGIIVSPPLKLINILPLLFYLTCM